VSYLFVVTLKLTVLFLPCTTGQIFLYLLLTTNVIKFPKFWFLKSAIPTFGVVLIATVRPDLISQLLQCDLQVESKFSRIRWLTPVQCPVTQPLPINSHKESTKKLKENLEVFNNVFIIPV
jgi:hypothetical protein